MVASKRRPSLRVTVDRAGAVDDVAIGQNEAVGRENKTRAAAVGATMPRCGPLRPGGQRFGRFDESDRRADRFGALNHGL